MVFCDSRGALELCSRRIPIWRQNGWRNPDERHHPLLQELSAVLEGLTVEWKWVRGHKNNPGNQRADELAGMGAREAKALLKERV
ncbi:MAG: hypothetical protein NDJ90_01250 [Oligoflexia bacterium]|nr:hypothetical protein [Oligoflexia bacterium]